MKKSMTFPQGGVHPPEGKELSEHRDAKTAPFPARAIIPMSQHIGIPAECIVKPGDVIEEEQLIGKKAGFVSANIHSSIPGKVVEIKDVFLPNSIRSQSVVIEMEGSFSRSGKETEKQNWKELDSEAIVGKITEAGIVGMGGATFPSHVKFSLPKGKVCDTLIINGVECEPFLTSDHKLMLEESEGILEGIAILSQILSPKRVCIGIEMNKPDAIEKMENLVNSKNLPFEVSPLKVKYPQGAEKNLVKAITGLEVPSGKLPLEVGAIIANVSTVFAVYEAVTFNRPVVERYVTVSGGAVAEPRTLKVRVGTPVKDLIEECGGLVEEPVKLISGGPMMGFTFYDLETPVTKGTSGILALTAKEVKTAEQSACLSCGRCIDGCPMGLNPTRLFKLLDHGKTNEAGDLGLLDCVECGSCAFMCPARIPLVHGFRVGKKILRSQQKKA